MTGPLPHAKTNSKQKNTGCADTEYINSPETEAQPLNRPVIKSRQVGRQNCQTPNLSNKKIGPKVSHWR